MSTSKKCLTGLNSFREIQIPVCHGHLAAKVWGNLENTDCKKRILAFHGWQDNANSFDPLILQKDQGLHRFFDDGLCLVCVDFSGHGLSSHLPPGSIYGHHTYVMDIFSAANFLGWDKFSVLGHSMGGGIGFYAAFLYPERVRKLACIDATFPIWCSENFFELSIESSYLMLEKFSADYLKGKIPSLKEYTEEEYFEAAKRFASLAYPDTPEGSTTKENTLILLERGSKTTSEGKFVLRRDPNTRAFFAEMSGPYKLASFFGRFEKKPEMLFLKPELGVKHFEETYAILAEHGPQNLKYFEISPLLKASHHVHMNEPEKVLPKLTDFLLSR